MSAPMSDSNVKLDIFYGSISIESRMRPEGNRMVGEGRRITYDRHGNVTEDTGWRRTGVDLILPEPETRRWWEFWK